MSKILEEFDWTYTSRFNSKARTRFYPWDAWFDGQIHELSQGEDFDGPPASMERVVRTTANRRKARVRVRVTENDTVVLQRHDDTNTDRRVTKPLSERTRRQRGFIAKGAKPSTNGEPIKTTPAKSQGGKAKGHTPEVAKTIAKRVTKPAQPSKKVARTATKAAARKGVSKRQSVSA